MLQRMYTRWAERHGMKVELIDHHSGEQAGIKSATILVKGENAYGNLKTESGVHRLVRISPYEFNARRHTSFASVWVYPEVDDDIDIEINEADLRIDTYRASGAGGQHVNTTDSAVRITHIPTGSSSPARTSARSTRTAPKAMKQLKARLYEAELQKREAEADAANAAKTDIGWGHQIRVYVLQPYQLVKDLRTGVTSTAPRTCSTATSTGSWPRPCRSASPARRSRSRMSTRPCRACCVAAALAACRAGAERAAIPRGRARRRADRRRQLLDRGCARPVGEAEAGHAPWPGSGPGMSVADIGAGEGYYTVRLARVVGPRGPGAGGGHRPGSPRPAGRRVQREGLDNVAVKLGPPDNPMLPAAFDRIFLVHMYHEVESPYEFLWHLRAGLKPDGLVVVVDADRPVKHHGTPPALLDCEFAALGLEPVKFDALTRRRCLFMAFRAPAPRPAPDKIKPARARASPSPQAGIRSPANTRWSSTAKSSASATDASRRVTRQSVALGRGSPLGGCGPADSGASVPRRVGDDRRIGNSAPSSWPACGSNGRSAHHRRHARPRVLPWRIASARQPAKKSCVAASPASRAGIRHADNAYGQIMHGPPSDASAPSVSALTISELD